MNGDSIRMIENPARRMQRLGFLKFLVWRSSQRATSSMQVVGSDLVAAVTKQVQVPATVELAEYARVVFAGQTSRPLIERIGAALRQSPPDNMVSVEIQDAYLSSRHLPSRRGRLVSNDWKNYPYLATALGLIRRESFSVLVRGLVLLNLTSPLELGAFNEYSFETNPLVLTTSQKLLLLQTFVEHDEHVLLPMYRSLLAKNGEFADWEAGDLLPDILRDLFRRQRASVKSGADNVRLQRLLETAKTIEQWRGREYKGTGARDSAATLRLEPFVDLGILRKRAPFAYRYEFTPTGRDLMTRLTDDTGGYESPDSRFFTNAVECYGLSRTHLTDTKLMLRMIYSSFRAIMSPLGYAPIREVLLLASISAIEQAAGYFELSEGLKVLQQTQQSFPHIVRFNVDRWGNVNFVKFAERPEFI